MVCKRQEQCKFGKMCGWAKDEETLLTECVEFIEIVPLTNEEWFDGLSTEEKAEAILKKTTELRLERKWSKRYIEEWLREKHYEM